MSRIFDISDNGEPSEATDRQVKFLRAFLFDKSCTDENWRASMDALLIVFGQQCLRSDDPVASFRNAIEMLTYAAKRTP